MRFRFNCWLLALGCFAIYGTILSLTSGCTLLPQEHLLPALVEHHDNKPLDPMTEVDIREDIIGPGVYTNCGPKGYLAMITGGALLGCARLGCAGIKRWETEKICTCQIYLMFDWDPIRDHEMKHCLGYGEL